MGSHKKRMKHKMMRLAGEDEEGKVTELRLSLTLGGGITLDASTRKRGFSETTTTTTTTAPDQKKNDDDLNKDVDHPPTKAQIVGWPPIRSYRKNNNNLITAMIKVSIDGAPYLRKVDLIKYNSYQALSDALGKMFSSFTIGKQENDGNNNVTMIDFMNESKLMDVIINNNYVPTYEDKDGDWMLVGDVPWDMFVESCKRVRIMKGKVVVGVLDKRENRGSS